MTIHFNKHIGIRQFFTRQNFPNPDSSIFSTVKILRHAVNANLQAKTYAISIEPPEHLVSYIAN